MSRGSSDKSRATMREVLEYCAERYLSDPFLIDAVTSHFARLTPETVVAALRRAERLGLLVRAGSRRFRVTDEIDIEADVALARLLLPSLSDPAALSSVLFDRGLPKPRAALAAAAAHSGETQ